MKFYQKYSQKTLCRTLQQSLCDQKRLKTIDDSLVKTVETSVKIIKYAYLSTRVYKMDAYLPRISFAFIPCYREPVRHFSKR